MSDGTNILDTLWHSMKRFTLRQGYAPAYVELGKDEMDQLRAEAKREGVEGSRYYAYGVEMRERLDTVTWKEWNKLLRS